MTPAEIDDGEDTFEVLLAAADEALAAGLPLPATAPQDRARLERAMACVRMLRAGGTSPDDTADQVPLRIGRFLIRRELGRGGFGVVFLADDPAVNREVALKVPRADVFVTPDLRERFQREARAAASLDHPNIVPVYEAGQVGPISYIASAYYPGPTLADWLRQRAKPVAFADAARFVSTLVGAVQHAHERGVLHRDLKPANILLTGVSSQESGVRKDIALTGDSWLLSPRVTDFGLAKLLDAAGSTCVDPTRTGAVLGTPSYMAPEQAGAQGHLAGPATDVYALGAILYELLTGRPPFRGETDLDTLLQVRAIDPIPPSRLRPQTPRDVETICLKCLAKEPARRYGSAGELAADLNHWLGNEPIRARPPSAAYRLRKFSRRNRAVLAIAVSILFALVLSGGGIGWAARDRTARRAAMDHEIGRALDETESAYERGQFSAASAAVKRAQGFLATGGGPPDAAERVHEWGTDLEMVARLEQIRLDQASAQDRAVALAEADTRYGQAFSAYGADVAALTPDEAAARLQGRRIKVELAAALDGWATARRQAGQPDEKCRPLLQLASACDPDPWRNRVRDGLARRDRDGLIQLAGSEQVGALPSRTLAALGDTLRALGAVNEAARQLRQAQRQHPGDFWLNYALAWCLTELKPARHDQAIRFYTAALALRGTFPQLHHNLGVSLVETGQFGEAEHAFREAIRLKSDFADAHNGLGVAAAKQKRFDEAIDAFREAIRLNRNWVEPNINLGLALHSKGHRDDATAQLRDAARRWPGQAPVHQALGWMLWEQDFVDEALLAYREAIRLKDDLAPAHSNLGLALASQGHFEEAKASLERALQLKPDQVSANVNLAVLLANGPESISRDLIRASDCARRAASVEPQHLWVLGIVHYRDGRSSAAVQVLEDWLKQGKTNYRVRFFLAMAHWQLGDKERARRHYDQACREVDKNAASLQRKRDKTYREELQRLRLEAAQLLAMPIPAGE